MENDEIIRIISHNDADGISAAAVIANALKEENVQFHTTIVPRLKEDVINQLRHEQHDLFIFSDMGSSFVKEFNTFKSDVIIADHHQVDETESESNVVHVNPHLFEIDGSKDLSGAGSAYLCVRNLDKKHLAYFALVGAFGDNDLQYNDNYYIYYFEEPAISSGTQTVTVNYIRFGYPDNKAHNTETLMYDNVEQMFYIVDKVKSGICHLYKLPFSTTYGTTVQRLTEVCALGNGSKFNYCTGGDITPDGRWMAIKSKPYVLLWERQGSESLSTTALRNPVQIMAYQEEKQGESLAWLDASTFYTTSDQTKDMPIYKYVRANVTSSLEPVVDSATKSEVRCVKMLRDGQLLIKQGDAIYTIQGQRIQ